MSLTSIATIASLPLAVQGLQSLESVGERLIDSIGNGASFFNNLAGSARSSESTSTKPSDPSHIADPLAAVVDKLRSLFQENGVEGPFELMARTGTDSELNVEISGVDAEKVERAIAQQPELMEEVGKLVNSLSAATGGTFQAIFRMTEQGAEVSYGG